MASSVEPWRGAFDAPIFAPLAPLLVRCPQDRFPDLEDLNRLLADGVASGGGARLHFVPPAAPSRAFDAQYEVRVFASGAVQTRTGDWHDLFNALVWIAFPKTKAALNRGHFEHLDARRGQAFRGTARDVLTLFDEGGVIVASGDPGLSQLLRESRWKPLFWERRAEVVRRMRFFVFGHAIYEKALAPYRGVTAKALIVEVEEAFFASPIERQLERLDARASAYFAGPGALASTKTLPPLPVLGVPGWEPANETEAYYDDVSQFRPGRRRE